jgi:hypothetical protein
VLRRKQSPKNIQKALAEVCSLVANQKNGQSVGLDKDHSRQYNPPRKHSVTSILVTTFLRLGTIFQLQAAALAEALLLCKLNISNSSYYSSLGRPVRLSNI